MGGSHNPQWLPKCSRIWWIHSCLNNSYSNYTDTGALGSLLEVLAALLETRLCQQPPLPPQPAAACGPTFCENHRKVMFSQAETARWAVLVCLHVYTVQETPQKAQVMRPCTFPTEPQTPHSFSCRLLLLLHFGNHPCTFKDWEIWEMDKVTK